MNKNMPINTAPSKTKRFVFDGAFYELASYCGIHCKKSSPTRLLMHTCQPKDPLLLDQHSGVEIFTLDDSHPATGCLCSYTAWTQPY